jgi:predicted enzyme related to lactoylglutathione lyase
MLRELYLVELTVTDWLASVAWYEAFGLRISLKDEKTRYALLETPRGRVALKQGNANPGSVLIGLEVSDLAAEIKRLAEQGIAPESPVKNSAEGYRRAIFRDPDGYRFSLFEWRTR